MTIKELTEVSALWNWKSSNTDLADEHGLSKIVVATLRKMHGIEPSVVLRARCVKFPVTKDKEHDRIFREFSVFVIEELARRKWSQTELAGVCGITQSAVSQKLKLGTGWSLQTICAIAEAFGKRAELRFVDLEEKK